MFTAVQHLFRSIVNALTRDKPKEKKKKKKIVNAGSKKFSVMADSAFPTTLKDFGYAFDQGGKLRKLDKSGQLTGDGFEFNVSDDHAYNQKRYEALGQVIDEYVYGLLEEEGLSKLPVSKSAGSSSTLELKSFLFASSDAFQSQKLMVLIHGNGVVRAGQWARRLIINDSLETGTQLPYIRKAQELGYGVLVLNTNDNIRNVNGKPVKIPGSEDPHNHMETVWKQYIEPSSVKHIAIVAHSYGGVCAVKFAMEHAQDFRSRVFAVGLTDSVHTIPDSKNTHHILKVARNWVSSAKPLDTPGRTSSDDIERYSAGHPMHEMTSYSCMESLFRFIEDRYNEASQKSDL